MTLDYTYASARIAAMESRLLSVSQLELLLSAKGLGEFTAALYDTWLAPYLKRGPDVEVDQAIDTALEETKHILMLIAPEPHILDLLWIKYDYHNLLAVLQGIDAGASDKDILAMCYTTGTMAPELLLHYVHEDVLARHDAELAHTLRAARKMHGAAQDDVVIRAYFARTRALVENSKDVFARMYVEAMIDIHNVKALARAYAHPELAPYAASVPGGTIEALPIDSPILSARLARYGGISTWKQAITRVLEHKEVRTLECAADNAFTAWVKYRSMARDDIADVFAYFHAIKNNVQIVRAIEKAKRTGMHEKTLRNVLRNLYT